MTRSDVAKHRMLADEANVVVVSYKAQQRAREQKVTRLNRHGSSLTRLQLGIYDPGFHMIGILVRLNCKRKSTPCCRNNDGERQIVRENAEQKG